jgi:LmeA-like phospholipid-binding
VTWADGQDEGRAPGPGYERVRRRRWPWVLAIILVVLVALAVTADFIARSVVQGRVAAQIQRQGFATKPTVTIEGFPFLTQVASRDIHQVRLSAHNVPEGPVQISAVSAVLTDVRLNSGFTGGTVGQVSGSLFVTFPALARTLDSQIGTLGSLASAAGLTLSAAGPGEVRASVNLVVASGTATWRVSRLTGNEFGVNLVGSTGIPGSVLSSIRDFTITLPRLPLGVRMGSVQITPRGLVASVTGHDLPFGS